jgi:hypothetical protein
LDDNGINEIIFGTNTGRIIAVDINTTAEILNVSIFNREITSLLVTNVNVQPGIEIITSSLDGICCYNYNSRSILWKKSNYPIIDEMESILNDSYIFSDIVFLSRYQLIRIDGYGQVKFNSTINPIDNEIGPYFSIAQIEDEHNNIRLFITDYGSSSEHYPGTPRPIGRHIWVFDSESGENTYSHGYKQFYFTTESTIYYHNNSSFIACGIFGDLSIPIYSDIFIFNCSSFEYKIYEILTGRKEFRWMSISTIPNSVSPTFLLCSNTAKLISWSLGSQSFTQYFNGSSYYRMREHPMICDIDHDNRYEIIMPLGYILIFDSISGDMEHTIEVDSRVITKVKIGIGDLDKDSYSELYVGYLIENNKNKYLIKIIDSPLIENKLNPEVSPPGLMPPVGKSNGRMEISIGEADLLTLWFHGGRDTGGQMGIRLKGYPRNIHLTMFVRDGLFNCHLKDDEKLIWEDEITLNETEAICEEFIKSLDKPYAPNQTYYQFSERLANEIQNQGMTFSGDRSRWDMKPALVASVSTPPIKKTTIRKGFLDGDHPGLIQTNDDDFIVIPYSEDRMMKINLDIKKTPLYRHPFLRGWFELIDYIEREHIFEKAGIITVARKNRLISEINGLLLNSFIHGHGKVR